MIKTTFKTLVAVTLTLSLGSNSWSAPIKIALKPDKNPEAMLEERKTLESYLSEKLKQKVEVIVPLSNAVILEGLKQGSLDLAFIGSTDMALALKDKSAEALLVVKIKNQTYYQSYWLTLKEKKYKSIEDLKGKPIAFASRTSTSGYIAPHATLIKRGLLGKKEDPEKFFGKGNVWYGTGYVSGIEQLFQGRAEAAAVSDYVFDKDKHLTPEQISKLKIIDRSGPIPTHILAVSTKSKFDKTKLQDAFLSMNQEAVELRNKTFSDEWTKTESAEKHIASVQEFLELIGIN